MLAATLPTPKGHFITGNFTDFAQDPLAFFTNCARSHGDFVRLRFGPFPFYLINHPDYIESVLVTDRKNFSKGPALKRSRRMFGNGLLTTEGSFWQRQRRLSQPAFHHSRIAKYAQITVECALAMLATWRDGEIREINQEMMQLTLLIVAKTLFGADVSKDAINVRQSLGVVFEEMTSRMGNPLQILIPDNFPTPSNLRLQRAIRQLDKIIYTIIRSRRLSNEEPGDLLSMLLHIQDEDGTRMTDKQLRDELITLFLAGHETTANSMTWTWMLLSQHPTVAEKLIAELDSVLGDRPPTMADLPQLRYTEMIVKESMRLYPPVWTIGRQAIEKTEIGGYVISPGETVLMSQWVMHRDPRYFDMPLLFKPERWADNLEKRLPNHAYFPFGGGERICIGKSFARMEAVLLLAAIARSFRLSLVANHPVVLQPSITLRPKHGMKMQVSHTDGFNPGSRTGFA